MTDSQSGTTTSTYNDADLLASRTMTASSQTLEVDLTYNSDLQMSSATRKVGGTTVGNGTYTYTLAGQVQSIIDYVGATYVTVLDSFAYSYDAAGQVATASSSLAVSQNYGYDGNGQLTSANSAAYAYDAEGNRTGASQTYNADNELTADANFTYTYDAAGNLTQKENKTTLDTWKYGYDNANQMLSAQEYTAPTGGTLERDVEYKYDVFGDRVEIDDTQGGTTATTRFAFDGWNPAMAGSVGSSAFAIWGEFTSGGSLTTRYMDSDTVDQVFARIDANGPAWLLTDMLGSVRDVTDGTGLLRDNIQYDAFGNITAETQYNGGAPNVGTAQTPQTDTWGGRYKWAGQPLDVATGLYEMRARYYDPTAGRMISQDPEGFSAGDSNLYRYVNNAPTNYTDPSGELLLISGEPSAKAFVDLIGAAKPSVAATYNSTGVRDLFVINIAPFSTNLTNLSNLFGATGQKQILNEESIYTTTDFTTVAAAKKALVPLELKKGEWNLMSAQIDAAQRGVEPGGPGQLFISTGNVPPLTDKVLRERAKIVGAVVSTSHPKTLKELQEVIQAETKTHGKFRMITIEGHAGGAKAPGPGVTFSPGVRLDATTDRNELNQLKGVLSAALSPGGIFRIASCGYESVNAEGWAAYLQTLADLLGVPVAASPKPLSATVPSPDPGLGAKAPGDRAANLNVKIPPGLFGTGTGSTITNNQTGKQEQMFQFTYPLLAGHIWVYAAPK